jgi:alcohol dehydrogenase class IV
MINSLEDIEKFISDKSFKKIFILSGKKSFVTSGAENFFRKIIKNKNIKFFYKHSEVPILDELIKIIKEIRNYKPDLLTSYRRWNSN